MFSPDFLYK